VPLLFPVVFSIYLSLVLHVRCNRPKIFVCRRPSLFPVSAGWWSVSGFRSHSRVATARIVFPLADSCASFGSAPGDLFSQAEHVSHIFLVHRDRRRSAFVCCQRAHRFSLTAFSSAHRQDLFLFCSARSRFRSSAFLSCVIASPGRIRSPRSVHPPQPACFLCFA
jgi:hypothetical protein